MTKPPKLTETVAVDDGTLHRISDLPDSLLVRILSLLPTTKDAFRSCLVSKRWQYLWTSIDNLTLVCSSTGSEKFLSFVDYALAQRTCSNIRKFHLEIWDMPSYSLHIEQWLSYVIENKVEHVVLRSIFYKLVYTLPQFFYTCSSLITLELMSCVFDKGAVISWKSLKTVSFKMMKLDD